MSTISIQDKINDAKIRLDKALFEADIFFITEKKESDDQHYIGYYYFAAINNQRKFGLLAFDEKKKKPEFIVEWVEMSIRNEKEGMEDPISYIILKNEKEFIDYFCGVSLSKILSKKK
jgi:alpha-glucuronidase